MMTHDYKAALEDWENVKLISNDDVIIKHGNTIAHALQLAQEAEQLRKERDELAAAVLDMDVKMESYGIYTGRTQDVIELAKKVSENGNA